MAFRGSTTRLAKTTKIDEVTFAGSSGERHTFRVYVWQTKFKPVPGVYIVASRTVDPGQPAQYAPLFVGEASDLSNVMSEHPRDECFQMYYGNVVGVLKEEDSGRRTAIVADLHAALALPCQTTDTL
jgi:hypothetical protein